MKSVTTMSLGICAFGLMLWFQICYFNMPGILGHTNASFTLDTYTHVTSDMQKQACGIVGGFMEDIFGKELKPWQESEKPVTER